MSVKTIIGEGKVVSSEYAGWGGQYPVNVADCAIRCNGPRGVGSFVG